VQLTDFDTGVAFLLLHIFMRSVLEISPAANRRSVGVKACTELRKHIADKKARRKRMLSSLQNRCWRIQNTF